MVQSSQSFPARALCHRLFYRFGDRDARSLLSSPVAWFRALSQSYTWKLLAMVACTNHLLKESKQGGGGRVLLPIVDGKQKPALVGFSKKGGAPRTGKDGFEIKPLLACVVRRAAGPCCAYACVCLCVCVCGVSGVCTSVSVCARARACVSSCWAEALSFHARFAWFWFPLPCQGFVAGGGDEGREFIYDLRATKLAELMQLHHKAL